MLMLYPAEWFADADETECDPEHTAACNAVGLRADDEEIGVSRVDGDEARAAMRRAGVADDCDEQDRFFVVGDPATRGYVRLAVEKRGPFADHSHWTRR